jgi:hypothetical protein
VPCPARLAVVWLFRSASPTVAASLAHPGREAGRVNFTATPGEACSDFGGNFHACAGHGVFIHFDRKKWTFRESNSGPLHSDILISTKLYRLS